MELRGRCSWFGGPADVGVAPDEGLAFIYEVSDAPHLFLPEQPPGTTGLARRLDPSVFYIATRWNYDITPKSTLIDMPVTVRAPSTGITIYKVHPADWGPNENTNRIADLSPGLMDALGIETDEEVEVTYQEAPMEGYDPIVISSGHGKLVRGASCPSPGLDEVDEARRVVDEVARKLEARDVEVSVFHDDKSSTQSQNLQTIVAYHDAKRRMLDVSVHFNAYNGKAHGTEVLYLTQEKLAREMSAAIAKAGGFTDRGPKKRTDLAFLNNTDEPAILLEICFVDNFDDADKYRKNFNAICTAIADVLSGTSEPIEPIEPVEPVEPVEPIEEASEVVVKIDITVELPPDVKLRVIVNGEDVT